MAIQSRQTSAAFLPSAFSFDDPGCGRVFVDSVLAHVRDCDNDERVDNFGANQTFRRANKEPNAAAMRIAGNRAVDTPECRVGFPGISRETRGAL